MGGRSSSGGNKVTANATATANKATQSNSVKFNRNIKDLVSDSQISAGRFKELARGVYVMSVGERVKEFGDSSALVGRIENIGGPYKASFIAFNMADPTTIGVYNSDREAKKAVKDAMKKYLSQTKKKGQ